ncbi:hypothetical protein CF327_g7178 [Tilletia walkeri]|nr:hypothetical protein CF327_g7178 [Tilletia walkeri]
MGHNQHRPFGENYWDKVASGYNTRAVKDDFKERRSKNPKDKFNTLLQVKKPTGDPNCPPEVKRAKPLQREIATENPVLTTEDDDADDEDEDLEVDNDDNDDEDGAEDLSESDDDVDLSSSEEEDNDDDAGANGHGSASAPPPSPLHASFPLSVTPRVAQDPTSSGSVVPSSLPPVLPSSSSSKTGKKRARPDDPASSAAPSIVAPVPDAGPASATATPKPKRAKVSAAALLAVAPSPLGAGQQRLPLAQTPSSDPTTSHQLTQLALQVSGMNGQLSQALVQIAHLEPKVMQLTQQLARSPSSSSPLASAFNSYPYHSIQSLPLPPSTPTTAPGSSSSSFIAPPPTSTSVVLISYPCICSFFALSS